MFKVEVLCGLRKYWLWSEVQIQTLVSLFACKYKGRENILVYDIWQEYLLSAHSSDYGHIVLVISVHKLKIPVWQSWLSRDVVISSNYQTNIKLISSYHDAFKVMARWQLIFLTSINHPKRKQHEPFLPYNLLACIEKVSGQGL